MKNSKVSHFPKVTVLMPVYNGERFLRDAIDSILTQTFTDFEFLIINDGSTDRSNEIIESYDDPRIRLVNNESNMGLAETLNKGVKYASGEYIARMDCDDISLPNRLMKQVAFMDDHPEVGVCSCWHQILSEGALLNTVKNSVGFFRIKCQIFFKMCFTNAASMFRRSMFINNGLYYDPQFISGAEDYDLFTRALNYMQIASIPEVFYYYRQHSSGMSVKNKDKIRNNVRKIHERLLNELGIYPSNEEKDIHESIIAYNFKETKDYLEKVNAWLLKIKYANLDKKIYAEPYFSDQLSSLWFTACYWTARYGNNTWNILIKSPLYNKKQISYNDKVKLLLKCLVKFW